MSDTLQTVTESTPIPSVLTDEAESISRVREQIAALASAVDGLYDEFEKLTLQKPGGRLLGDSSPLGARDARMQLARVARALRRAGSLEQYGRRVDNAVPSRGTASSELELWLAGHTG